MPIVEDQDDGLAEVRQARILRSALTVRAGKLGAEGGEPLAVRLDHGR